jgi:hypothetical protein
MNFKVSKTTIILLAILLIGTLIFLLFSKKNKQNELPRELQQQTIPQRVNKDHPEKKIIQEQLDRHEKSTKKLEESAMQKLKKIYNSPIIFFGVIIDEDNQPVEGANIYFSALNEIGGKGTKYSKTSNVNGSFNISKISGAELYVKITKDGYHSPYKTSQRSFRYDAPQYSQHPIPTKDNPAIFVLKKKGETEPLVKYTKGAKIPVKGTPIGFNLKSGKIISLNNADLIVTATPGKKPSRREKGYAWSYELKVPNGGIIEKLDGEDKYSFTAPEEGYQSVFKHEVTKSLKGESWTDVDERRFYVRLADKSYVDLTFRLVTGGHHFMVINGLYNPIGSPNLEYDPSKRIK